MKYAAIALAAILLSACGKKKIEGYIVAKEYTAGHMSDKTASRVQYAYVPVVVVPRTTSKPHYVASTFIIWIANRYDTYEVNVDSTSFYNFHCGQKASFIR